MTEYQLPTMTHERLIRVLRDIQGGWDDVSIGELAELMTRGLVHGEYPHLTVTIDGLALLTREARMHRLTSGGGHAR